MMSVLGNKMDRLLMFLSGSSDAERKISNPGWLREM